MKKPLLPTTAAALFFSATSAIADTGNTGPELMIRGGYGGAGSESPIQVKPGAPLASPPGALLKGESPYGGGLTGQISLGYRFHPLFSAGLQATRRGDEPGATPKQMSDGTSANRNSWGAGFYLRAYPLAVAPGIKRYVDPWVSVGVGYTLDQQKYDQEVATNNGGKVTASTTLDHHGVAIPVGIGLDYRVLPILSVGPSFEYALVQSAGACMSTTAPGYLGTSYCTNGEPGASILEGKSYGVWSAALNIKVTPL